jgi:hypothetical protein
MVAVATPAVAGSGADLQDGLQKGFSISGVVPGG